MERAALERMTTDESRKENERPIERPAKKLWTLETEGMRLEWRLPQRPFYV